MCCEAGKKETKKTKTTVEDLDTSLEDIVFLKELTDDLFLPAPRPCCSCRYVFRCSLAFTNHRCAKVCGQKNEDGPLRPEEQKLPDTCCCAPSWT